MAVNVKTRNTLAERVRVNVVEDATKIYLTAAMEYRSTTMFEKGKTDPSRLLDMKRDLGEQLRQAVAQTLINDALRETFDVSTRRVVGRFRSDLWDGGQVYLTSSVPDNAVLVLMSPKRFERFKREWNERRNPKPKGSPPVNIEHAQVDSSREQRVQDSVPEQRPV